MGSAILKYVLKVGHDRSCGISGQVDEAGLLYIGRGFALQGLPYTAYLEGDANWVSHPDTVHCRRRLVA